MKGITRLAHVAIKVADIDNSLRYYRDGLECPEMFRLEKNGRLWIVYLKLTETQFIELFPDAVGQNPPFGTNAIDHLCVEVSDLEAVVQQILANGIEVYRWVETPAGLDLLSAGADAITWGADENRQAWLRDPDGNRIELMQMMNGNLQEKALARLRAAGA